LNAHSPLLRPWAYDVIRPHRAGRKNAGTATQDRNRRGSDRNLHFGGDFAIFLSMGRIGGANKFRLCILAAVDSDADLVRRAAVPCSKISARIATRCSSRVDDRALSAEGAHQEKIASRTSRSNDRQG
jgi:hypothetical protein